MKPKKTRTERTLSVVNVAMDKGTIAQIASLANDPRYEALLDVMERGCILQDTVLINTPEEEEATVLARHKYSKAMWSSFIYIQTQVKLAEAAMNRVDEEEEEPEPIEEDVIQGIQGISTFDEGR